MLRQCFCTMHPELGPRLVHQLNTVILRSRRCSARPKDLNVRNFMV